MIRHKERDLAMVRFSTFVAALASFASASVADAAAVVLWPVDPTIAAGESSTAIWIENRSDETVTMQIRSLGWKQTGGEDDYGVQDAVVASPPIAEVAPGARQLVRVIRRAPSPPPGEQAYRLLIDELPKPTAEQGAGASATLAVQMRYSIPLFTYGSKDKGRTQLSSRIVLAEGKRFVEIRNSGTRHARLTDLKLAAGGRSTTLLPGLIGYVLAGSTRRIALPDELPAQGGGFTVAVDGVDQPLTVSA